MPTSGKSCVLPGVDRRLEVDHAAVRGGEIGVLPRVGRPDTPRPPENALCTATRPAFTAPRFGFSWNSVRKMSPPRASRSPSA